MGDVVMIKIKMMAGPLIQKSRNPIRLESIGSSYVPPPKAKANSAFINSQPVEDDDDCAFIDTGKK
jgi:hypothetical protein